MSTVTMKGFGLLSSIMVLSVTFAHTVLDMNKLIDDKTLIYNKKCRPVFDQDETVYVGMSFELMAIREFDEVSEKFSVVGIVIMGWHDQLLQWDPQEYGNMTEFASEGGDFWQPRIVLANAHDKMEAVGNAWIIFRYYSSGMVTVAPGDVFDVSCSVDVTKYPWDEQSCFLYFIPWGYNAEEVMLTSIDEFVGTTFFSRNGAWDVVNTSTASYIDDEGSSQVVFKMRLRRKPRFVLVNVTLPVVLMSFLNLIVFVIPTESGERISYCLTVLLAIAVFFTLVGDNLPKTSNPMSLLSYYLLVVLVTSVCVVFATAYSVRIYFRDEKKHVPRWLGTLIKGLRCNSGKETMFGCKTGSDQKGQSTLDPQKDNTSCKQKEERFFHTKVCPEQHNHQEDCNNINGDGIQCPDSKQRMHGKGSVDELSMSSVGNDTATEVSWKDVSRTLDGVFSLVFLFLLIGATILFFVMIMRDDENTES